MKKHRNKEKKTSLRENSFSLSLLNNKKSTAAWLLFDAFLSICWSQRELVVLCLLLVVQLRARYVFFGSDFGAAQRGKNGFDFFVRRRQA